MKTRLFVLMIVSTLLAFSRPAFATAYTASYATGEEIPISASGFNAHGHTMSITLGYAPRVGTELTVVENTGTALINSNFQNLLHGSTVALNYSGTNYYFIANYYGGTGNDLVLTWKYNRPYGFGDNYYGQIGNSTTGSAGVPVATTISGVLAGKTIAQLAQGEAHTVALCTDGTVYTWGRNADGQLGDGTYTIRNAPVAVSTASPSDLYGGYKVIAVAAGSSHCLALRADGVVVAWGNNDDGQLGVGDRADRLYPVKISNTYPGSVLYPNKKIVSIAAGTAHSVALCSDGTVVSWGRNYDGQLGNNSTGSYPYYNEPSPVLVNTASGVSALFGKTVIRVIAARDASLALCSDGSVVGWGDNTYGVLGTSGSPHLAAVATDATSGSALFGKTVTDISTSGSHSLALCSDGSIAAWGQNNAGQLGNNTTTDSTVPVTMSAASGSALLGKTVRKISAGYSRSEAFCSDGTLTVSGSLFFTGSSNSSLPVAAPTTSLAIHEKFMDVSGTQGDSYHRLIRVGSPAPAIPYAVVQQPVGTDLMTNAMVDYGSPLSGSSVTKVFTIKNTGSATLTGLNVYIDPSTGSGAWSFTSGTPGSTTLAPGASTTVPITFTASTGSVWGIVEITSNADPVTFFVTGNATGSLNPTFTTGTEAAYTADNLNLDGVYLDVTLNHAPLPGTSLMLIDNTGPAFTAGSFAGLAHGDDLVLTYGGQSYYFVANYYGGNGNDVVLQWKGTRPLAWGDNTVGKLGDGTVVDKSSPARVVNTGVLAGKTVLKLASGGLHTLALLSDGTVAAWGENGSGQLGNGTLTDSSSPVLVYSGTFAGSKVISIAAGYAHSLALCENGKLYAWGYNASGQLGNNVLTASSYPVAVDTTSISALYGKNVSAIASSGNAYHSLAICSDGTLVAWGRNSIGCLGDGTVTTRKVPVAVSTASILSGKVVTSSAAGLNFSVALCADGTVASWGENVARQLGDGGTTDRSTPASVYTATVLPPGTYFRSISAGESHVLALRNDGRIASWGSATYDQTIHGLTTPSLVYDTDFVLEGRTVTAVSAGQHHSMAVCQDGYVACWGRNHTGQAGDGTLLSQGNLSMVSRESLRPGQGFSGISAGQTHTLGLVSSPYESLTVEESPYDYLTDEITTADFGAPKTSTVKTFTVRNTGITTLTGLNVTMDGANADRFSKTATTLANLAPGESVNFNVTFTPTAVSIGPKTAALHISTSLSGSLSSFDIPMTGTSLGYYYPITYTSASQVPVTASSIDGSACTLALSLAVSAPLEVGTQLMIVNHTGRDVIAADRQFQGLDQGEEVALESNDIRYIFIVDYYGGDGNDLVLRWQGTKGYGWGYNTFYGQVGDGTTTNRLLPTAILTTGPLAGKTIVAIDSGYYHTVALCSDGTVYSWGDNTSGQLGNNSTSAGPFTSPVQVHNTSGALLNKKVVAISSAGYHTLALCHDGTLVAWGNNSWGELGDNTVTVRRIPTLVNTTTALSGKRVAQIAAGAVWSMALCTDGTLAAWGSNFGGYVGVGYFTGADYRIPTRVDTSGRSALNGKSVLSIHAGGFHNLARCSDGSLLSWGEDTDKQLGDGAPTGICLAPVFVNTAAGVSALSGHAVTQMSAGASHSLAASASGGLFAWGGNAGGAVGDNTFTSRDFPVEVNRDSGVSALFGKNVVKISAGASTSYALCSDGNLAMWGSNSSGQLGINSLASQAAPVMVNTSTIGAGSRFCGIPTSSWSTSFGIVAPPQAVPQLVEISTPYNTYHSDDDLTDAYENWGADFGYIYLASGVTTHVSSRQKTFFIENLGTGDVSNVSITVGGTHPSLFTVGAITQDVYGRYTFTVTYTPATAGTHKATLSISSNGNSSYGIYGLVLRGTANTDKVDAVYDNGNESALITTVPFSASGKTLQLDLRHEPIAGRNLMVVNNQSNAAITGTFNYLGHGDAISDYYGSSFGTYVINYYGGDGNDIVLVWQDNAAFTWGVNGSGQLGNGTTTAATLPSAVSTGYPAMLEEKTILSTTTGGGHTLVLCSDGKVYAWGDNQYGQLGNSSTTASSIPVPVYAVSGQLLYNKRVLAIAAGRYHSMALYLNDSVTPNVVSVATWGRNDYGQLGNNIAPGTLPYSSVPVAVYNTAATSALYNSTTAKAENVYAIAAGENHCMALYNDSNAVGGAITTVATWGDNTHRQLGNNSAAASSQLPVTVTITGSAFATTKNALAIAAGSNHCLAIRSDGTAVTWGINSQGQGGTGSTSSYLAIPTSLSSSGSLSLKTVRAVAAGSNHSLALCSDSSIVVWGENADGQLGNNTTTASSSPVLVYLGHTLYAKHISAANNRSFALRYDNAVMTWGDNDGGRLGDDNYDSMLGIYPDALVPVFLDESILGYNDVFSELPKGPTAQHGIIIAPR